VVEKMGVIWDIFRVGASVVVMTVGVLYYKKGGVLPTQKEVMDSGVEMVRGVIDKISD
jgi:hypothetical protein